MPFGDLVHATSGSLAYHKTTGALIYSRVVDVGDIVAASRHDKWYPASGYKTWAECVSNLPGVSWGTNSVFHAYFYVYEELYGTDTRINAEIAAWDTTSNSGDNIVGIRQDVGALNDAPTGWDTYLYVYASSSASTAPSWATMRSQPYAVRPKSASGEQTMTLTSSVTLDDYLWIMPVLEPFTATPVPPFTTSQVYGVGRFMKIVMA